ncbi:hypothetical protein [Nocardia mangyaensis]|uniref:hypothetical protein n=1 Tax=Nocardia mangyaensis TaxID=2213200 RepID=UPI002674D504|nr:hypothetical protein [Nocardia mangyaensis]MDO3646365.1 hypothetical protein [Nocardia mangyaensis]
MTIHLTPDDMRSTRTPECAVRTGADPEVWQLSWLPERTLTRKQAFAGMQLDELLSDPHAVLDTRAHAQIEFCAAAVGIAWTEAAGRLFIRMIERLDGDPEEVAGQPTPIGRPRTATWLFAHPDATRRVVLG